MSGTVTPVFPMHSIDDVPTSIAPDFLIGDFEACGPGAWQDRPHRHEFVELAYVTGGSGLHHIDTEAVPIQPPQLFVIAPGQVHHWEPEEAIRGTLVLFREEFLTGVGGPVGALPHWSTACLTPDARRRDRIERLLADLAAEMEQPDAMQETALRTLLHLLLVQCRRMAPAQPTEPRGLAAEFERLVRERASASLTVAECARRLAVTPGYLSEIVAAQCGRTPGEMIRGEVVREAQRLLARSALSCAQVAAQLGFDDASYFSRFFRRECGVTPSGFRHRQSPHRGAA